MNKEIIKRRIKAIRRELSKRGIDCLIVIKPANVTYTTGFLGEDSWGVITRNKVYFITDSRYTEQAQVECEGCRIIERTGLIAEAAGKLIDKLKSVGSVAIEDAVSLADFKALKKHVKVRIKSVGSIIETVRSVKDDVEIKTIEAAASISAQALEESLRYIKSGITESELAGRIDFQIRKLGATNGFNTIVAFGANGSRPHHQPGRRKLRQKDTVLIDFGARYKSYCSDITRCFVVGRESAFYKKVYDVVEQAQAAAIKIIKAGVKMKAVDSAARAVIRDNDLPVYGHGSGHGFGLEIHELPFLKVESKGVLKTGQVLTIEPGIYMPGKLGVRIEDDVLVTRDGYKILTHKCPHAPLLS